jgi:hypothetical protein
VHVYFYEDVWTDVAWLLEAGCDRKEGEDGRKNTVVDSLVVIRIVSADTYIWQALGRHPDAGIGGWILSATLSASSLHPKMAGGGLLHGGVQWFLKIVGKNFNMPPYA